MSYRWFTLEEMAVTSTHWVTPGDPERAAIEKVPVLAALLPPLEKANTTIFALKARDVPQLQAITEQLAQAHIKHDNCVRGIYGTLTMLASVSPDDASDLLGLRDKLFPEGLSLIKMSHLSEVGHAALVASQVDAAMQARLKAVTVHKKNMLDLYNEWQTAAKQIGELEDERASLSEATPSAAKEIQAARNAWIRIVKTLVANAEVADLDPATDNLLFSGLRAAEQAAESRVHGKKEPVPAPAPSPAAAPASGAPHSG